MLGQCLHDVAYIYCLMPRCTYLHVLLTWILFLSIKKLVVWTRDSCLPLWNLYTDDFICFICCLLGQGFSLVRDIPYTLLQFFNGSHFAMLISSKLTYQRLNVLMFCCCNFKFSALKPTLRFYDDDHLLILC